MTVYQQAEEYIKHRPFGTVFSFGQIVAKLDVSKDSLAHALAKLEAKNHVSRLERGLWHRPKVTRFGVIGPKPETVAAIIVKERGAFVVPAGAAAVNALGWSTQMSMIYNYISTKRISPLNIGKHQINFRYSRAFEDAMKKLDGLNPKEKKRASILWAALEYLGENEAQGKSKLIQQSFTQLSTRTQKKFISTLNGKLSWVLRILE